MGFPLHSVPGPDSKLLRSDGTEAISNRLEKQQAGSGILGNLGVSVRGKRWEAGTEVQVFM